MRRANLSVTTLGVIACTTVLHNDALAVDQKIPAYLRVNKVLCERVGVLKANPFENSLDAGHDAWSSDYLVLIPEAVQSGTQIFKVSMEDPLTKSHSSVKAFADIVNGKWGATIQEVTYGRVLLKIDWASGNAVSEPKLSAVDDGKDSLDITISKYTCTTQ